MVFNGGAFIDCYQAVGPKRTSHPLPCCLTFLCRESLDVHDKDCQPCKVILDRAHFFLLFFIRRGDPPNHTVWYIIRHMLWDFFGNPVAIDTLRCKNQGEVYLSIEKQQTQVVDQNFGLTSPHLHE